MNRDPVNLLRLFTQSDQLDLPRHLACFVYLSDVVAICVVPSRLVRFGKSVRRGVRHATRSETRSMPLQSTESQDASKTITATLDKYYNLRLFLSFWVFGTLIAMQFSVVITAANDLVGDKAPTALILFAYTLPSLCVRTLVPFINFPSVRIPFWSKKLQHDRGRDHPASHGVAVANGSMSGDVDYPLRLTICAISSLVGLQLLAWSTYIPIRMLGISLASLSSNLGDMSFWQLATRFQSHISQAFGGYAAGGGSAGLLGAALYTASTTTFGISPEATLSTVGFLPSAILLVYAFLLPPAVNSESLASSIGRIKKKPIIGTLTLRQKLLLVQPLVVNYMLPLAVLFVIEGHLTQGVLPTLLFKLPFQSSTALFPTLTNGLFKATRDFFPVYITIFQLSAFLGRTSITFFRLPGGNSGKSWAYWIICLVEAALFLVLLAESVSMSHKSQQLFGIGGVILTILMVGPCGGLLLSNTYWKISKKPLPRAVWRNLRRIKNHPKKFEDEFVLSDHMPQPDDRNITLHKGGITDYYRNMPSSSPTRHETPSSAIPNKSTPLTTRSNASRPGSPSPRLSQSQLVPQTPHSQPIRPKFPSRTTSFVSNHELANSTRKDEFDSRRRTASEDTEVGTHESEDEDEDYYDFAEELGLINESRIEGPENEEEELAIREFLVSTIAPADTVAILLGSLGAMWLQPELCALQVASGRKLCRPH